MKFSVANFLPADYKKAIEINGNESEEIVVYSTPESANVNASIGTKRKKVQLALEEMKSNSEKSGVHNTFNGLNHSIEGVIYVHLKTDPKSEHEWRLFRGEPVNNLKNVLTS